MKRIRIGTFTPSVLLEVAKDTGRLDAVGLEVVSERVPSSPAQFTSLRDGAYDAVVTSPDNVIAYRFLPENPLGELMDVVIVAALDADAGLSLCLRPGLDDPKRARILGVDVPNSGFAFAAYGLLERAGLGRGDYDVTVLGASPLRARALLDGTCDATILGAGNELTALEGGARIASCVTELGPYVGEVLARLRGAGRAAEVDALADVLLDTARSIRSGALTAETTAATARALGISAAASEAHERRLRTSGLASDGRMPLDAVATLVRLRRDAAPSASLDAVLAGITDALVGPARG
jgi:ABC-type nitrate/sulfonate/bicarbonate transport system substrate-binding protein